MHNAVSVIFLDGDDVRRAPMLAALFNRFVRNEQILKLWNLKVDSAGSGQFTKEGAAPDQAAVVAMNSFGLDVSSHRARAISLVDIRKASLILAMEQKHINYVTQHVCDGYPGYVGTILFELAVPVMLGSWWALIPGGLVALLIITRTALEDKTLQKELDGYQEYAHRVRYRLLPGIW